MKKRFFVFSVFLSKRAALVFLLLSPLVVIAPSIQATGEGLSSSQLPSLNITAALISAGAGFFLRHPIVPGALADSYADTLYPAEFFTEELFYSLLGQAVGGTEGWSANFGKSGLKSYGYNIRSETVEAKGGKKNSVTALSKVLGSRKGYKVIALYMPDEVKDIEGNTVAVDSLVGRSWQASFGFGQERSQAPAAPAKIQNLKFKSCEFKDKIVGLCQRSEVNVFKQGGFQLNIGRAEGQCESRQEKCMPRAYGDMTIVFQKHAQLVLAKFEKVIALGSMCVNKGYPSHKRSKRAVRAHKNAPITFF